MSGGDLAVGVIGLGFGANHARILAAMEGVRLAAVCDADPARLPAIRAGATSCYQDHREMLARERLDAVVVALPPLLHEAVALDAIAAGCSVLVEKPLTPTLAGALRLAEAAEAAGVLVMPAHIERFNPALRELVRRARLGEAGRLLRIEARRLAHFIERPRRVDIGVVHDLAYHDIYVMREVAGREVELVFAQAQEGVQTPFADAVTALLRFEGDNGPGAVGSLEVNWLSPRLLREMSVLGESGLLLASYGDFRTTSLEFQPAQPLRREPSPHGSGLILSGLPPKPSVRLPLEPHEPLQLELDAFVRAVREGLPPPVRIEDAIAALAIADAIVESAATGRPVKPAREA